MNSGDWAAEHELLVRDQTVLDKLKQESHALKTIVLTRRQLCDVELLLNGGFSPLKGFMVEEDYNRVVTEMRLSNGSIFPIPITLDISAEDAANITVNQRLALDDWEGNLIALMTVESKWVPDKSREAELVFGSTDQLHPAVYYLFNNAGQVYLGGRLEGIQLPVHYDFVHLRRTPAELREYFRANGHERVVAFQTRNPLHRSHFELTVRALKFANALLLLHPSVGMTKPGDVDHFTRVRCYLTLMQEYEPGTALLSLLPLAMRMGGPREALWHAVIRKNYGATHFIVGRDHAGPGNNSQGNPFYGDYDAQKLVLSFEAELGLKILTFRQVAYVPELQRYLPEDEVTKDMTVKNISGTELRRRLAFGEPIPEWFSFPGVITILQESSPPRFRQGFTVFFTGLSGSGKSTISNALMVRLMELTNRSVTLLDGDLVRQHLSTELGFSKEHRDLNIKRIGYVASEITKAGGIALSAAIAPYQAPREYVRHLISNCGGFVEVYVATPLEICEKRDRKGLYKRARQGLIKGFTGIDDPYEPPTKAEIIIQPSLSVKESTDLIINYLKSTKYLL